MRTLELTSLNFPGQRVWAISRGGAKPDLIVTDIPADLPSWEVTNRAMEVEFGVIRTKRPLAQDVEDAEVAPPPTVTYAELLRAKEGAVKIMLRTKMGRPPKAGVARSERIDLRLTPVEKYVFDAQGGVHWLYNQLEILRQNSIRREE